MALIGEVPSLRSGCTSSEIGVSVVVCCHNSANVLPSTLRHLSKQTSTDLLKWEVIVVDNSSTDGTLDVARNSWPSECDVPFRIVCEPRLGLTFARERGIAESRYEFISFVDDDNWLSPDWVARVAAIMVEHPDVAALGGTVEPVFDNDFRWGDPSQHFVPISVRNIQTGDVTLRPDAITGAGMTLRRTALNELHSTGFQLRSIGRQGMNLAGGEDSELLLALRLLGWRQWHSADLLIRHFIPDHRTEWRYLRRLAFGSGKSSCALDALFYALKPARHGLGTVMRNVRQSWAFQVLLAAAQLLRYPSDVMLFRGDREGDTRQLLADYRRGHLVGLLYASTWYDSRTKQIRKQFIKP